MTPLGVIMTWYHFPMVSVVDCKQKSNTLNSKLGASLKYFKGILLCSDCNWM